MVSKYIRDKTDTVVMYSGEGADELCQGTSNALTGTGNWTHDPLVWDVTCRFLSVFLSFKLNFSSTKALKIEFYLTSANFPTFPLSIMTIPRVIGWETQKIFAFQTLRRQRQNTLRPQNGTTIRTEFYDSFIVWMWMSALPGRIFVWNGNFSCFLTALVLCEIESIFVVGGRVPLLPQGTQCQGGPRGEHPSDGWLVPLRCSADRSHDSCSWSVFFVELFWMKASHFDLGSFNKIH